MLFRQIYDPQLSQYAYLVGCQRTREALLVDPERDVDRYLEIARHEGLRITAVAETHIHADFVSGARELVARDPRVRAYLSAAGGDDWSYLWPELDGIAWTRLTDGATLAVGNVELRVVHTPGHTPEHLAYLVVDRGAGAEEPMALLSGDFVFVGDLGRPDLLETAAGVVGDREPSARRLFSSARRFLELPEWLQVWPGHGAGSACGKALGAVPTTTVGYERRHSPALAAVDRGERAFVDFILEGQPEPPPYFARMKRLNREGPPRMAELPRPRRISSADVGEWTACAGVAILDARRSRREVFGRHLRGALFAPGNRSFATVAGAYVEPEEEILLVAAEGRLDELLRGLVRVGLDRIAAWLPVEELPAVAPSECASIETIGVEEVAAELDGDLLLDVRGASEFATGHLPGARNLAHTTLRAELGSIPRDRRLLIYCESGARAANAGALLAREGFDLRVLDGELSQLTERLRPS